MRAKLLIISAQIFKATAAGAVSPFRLDFIFRRNSRRVRIAAENNRSA
jgi:hypothetical protein